MTENIEVAAVEEVEVTIVETPAPVVEEVVEAPKAASTSSEAPAPGTPEFAAWAWEHRNG